MSPWRAIGREMVGAWRSLRYDLGRFGPDATADLTDPDLTDTDPLGTEPIGPDPLGAGAPWHTGVGERARPPRPFRAAVTVAVLVVLSTAGSYLGVVAGLSVLLTEAPPTVVSALPIVTDRPTPTAAPPATTAAAPAGAVAGPPAAASPAATAGPRVPSVASARPSRGPVPWWPSWPVPTCLPGRWGCASPPGPRPTPTVPSATPSPVPTDPPASPTGNPTRGPTGSPTALPSASPEAGPTTPAVDPSPVD